MVFCNRLQTEVIKRFYGHNPYFNRWFSAINYNKTDIKQDVIVTILILIDGFLQLSEADFNISDNLVTILILIDGFLQSS